MILFVSLVTMHFSYSQIFIEKLISKDDRVWLICLHHYFSGVPPVAVICEPSLL